MESKEFTAALARTLGRDRKDVAKLLTALSQELRQHCGEQDSVAVPGFGTFVGEKHDEKIVDDLATGGKLLLPPEVVISFVPGTKLRNQAERRVQNG